MEMRTVVHDKVVQIGEHLSRRFHTAVCDHSRTFHDISQTMLHKFFVGPLSLWCGGKTTNITRKATVKTEIPANVSSIQNVATWLQTRSRKVVYISKVQSLKNNKVHSCNHE